MKETFGTTLLFAVKIKQMYRTIDVSTLSVAKEACFFNKLPSLKELYFSFGEIVVTLK